ncbi:MAG: hypothetical protein DYG89_53805 [Caldilinea sp. CFX5]|nr:hypothetical protein [Caldilinea sp. CFX5]
MEHVVSEQEIDETNNSDSSTARRHDLNAKEVVNAFAEQGLVCAILRPENQAEEDVNRSTSAADRADLVILDWQIKGDNGRTTKRIIRRILQNDDGRLRLIAIYTGEQDLIQIAEEVELELQVAKLKAIKNDQNPCTIDFGRVRIEILSKSKYSPYKGRNVSFEELPERLIASFSQMTAGIVSNAAVTAISAIRANTHKLLSNLHKDLSRAYLAQRALTKPEEALEFLSNIVSSELHSILEGYGLEEHDKAIKSWITENNDWDKDPLLQDLTKKKIISRDDLHNCLINGIPFDQNIIDKHSGKIATIICGSDAATRNAELAILTMMRSRYSITRHPPMLSLGTIVAPVANDNKNEYFVCVQPQCDSVRLDKDTVFPFLALKTTNSNDRFNFIVRDNDNLLYLKVINKSSALRTLIFKPLPENEGVIRANETKRGYEYTTIDNKTYKWIANLKEGPAQRIVHQFTSHLSRIGINEMEWLRLTADGKLK